MERYLAVCADCGLAVMNRQENHKRYGECQKQQEKNIQDFKIGMRVQVSHIGGTEIGYIDQINFESGKVVLYFLEGLNLNFCGFNISQIKKVS
jgi:hypothetical protein